MGQREEEFDSRTKKAALERQGFVCAVCGLMLWNPGKKFQPFHDFGEWAEAHHIKPVLSGGTADVQNCVVICQACHYSIHGGGSYKVNQRFSSKDFPHYKCGP